MVEKEGQLYKRLSDASFSVRNIGEIAKIFNETIDKRLIGIKQYTPSK